MVKGIELKIVEDCPRDKVELKAFNHEGKRGRLGRVVVKQEEEQDGGFRKSRPDEDCFVVGQP